MKKYRFLDTTSKKFLNEQVREGPRDLYFNQHELVEAYQSEKTLRAVSTFEIILFRVFRLSSSLTPEGCKSGSGN